MRVVLGMAAVILLVDLWNDYPVVFPMTLGVTVGVLWYRLHLIREREQARLVREEAHLHDIGRWHRDYQPEIRAARRRAKQG